MSSRLSERGNALAKLSMTNKNKLLNVLSDAEQEALYGLPDFDNGQRLAFLSLSEAELALASSRSCLHAQVYCVLQIGYFKAKLAFFRFDWSEVEDGCAFVLTGRTAAGRQGFRLASDGSRV